MAISIHRPKGDGHSIELEVRKPLAEKALTRACQRVDHSFRAFLRLARMGKPTRAPSVPRTQIFLQRCAVQVRYTKGGSIGKWYSHGSYIGRESKERDPQGRALGFGSQSEMVPIAATVARWRKERDEIFFRVILSPERGDQMDLEAHTREVLASAERDLGTKLEWAAVAHYNTDNPHVHVVLRGRDENGSMLFLPREYVREGFRRRAEEAATNQLGYRHENDILEMQRREVSQMRYTGLDRKLKDRAHFEVDRWRVQIAESRSSSPLEAATDLHLRWRLESLERMGLAARAGRDWLVDAGFEESLRTMQRAHDRLKMTAEHGVLASDRRLPFRVLRMPDLDRIEGRVLVTGQKEISGQNYVLVESIRGEVVQIPQVREFIELRQQGHFKAGSYLRLMAQHDPKEKGGFEAQDLGDAHSLVTDPAFLHENAARLVGEMAEGWSGWLGELRQAALATAPARRRHSTPGR